MTFRAIITMARPGRLAASGSTTILLACLATLPVLAQTAPDAGSLLREQPKAPGVAPERLSPTAPIVPGTRPQDAGPKIRIKGFRFPGALLVAEAELQAHLAPLVGQEFDFGQLDGLTVLITMYYMERGYLARAVLPPQEVKDGIVTLQIIEGKRGSLIIDNNGERIESARLRRFIDRRVGQGDALNLTHFGEALAILNEQPGVDVRSRLAAGKNDGEVDLALTAADKPLLGISLGANNHGSRGTGEYQGSAGLTLANPTGNLDAVSLLGNASEGNTFVRGDYSLAIGDGGLRLGVNASDMRYHLTQDSFAALKGTGTARTAGLTLSYPITRQSGRSLTLTAGADNKTLIDHTVAGETGNRRVNVTNLGLGGHLSDAVARHVISFGGSLVTGTSDQRNAGARTTDSTTRRVQGGFAKLSLNAGYLKPLGADWTVNATLRGQLAGKNLDSTERMSLGGPNAIRAYPASEATGDEAWLASINLGNKLGDALAANLFFDAGRVTLNHSTWTNWNAGNPRLPNRYGLAGVGVGLDWRLSPSALLTASIAAPLGSNPGRDTNNLNADGSPQRRVRGWLSLAAQF